MINTEELQILQTKIRSGWKAIIGLPSQRKEGEACLAVSDYYDMYWDPLRLIFLSRGKAKGLGFAGLDCEIIADIGIPCWAAPHLSFQEPESWGGNKVRIGEDGNENPILFGLEDRIVHVLEKNQVKPICVGLDGLVLTLTIYTAMIELAINNDRDAFRMNRVPLSLIETFRSIYCAEFGELYDGSFIEEEVNRLLGP